MTYRDHIKELFAKSQSLLQEYTAICIKIQKSQAPDPEMMEHCDRMFKEYNHVIRKHHELILEVTRRKVRLEDPIPVHLRHFT